MLEKLNKEINLEREERENSFIYKGFVGDDIKLFDYYLSLGNFTKVTEYCYEPYRKVYVDEDAETFFTYCEGDISFAVAKDWNNLVDEYNEFYNEN